MKNLIFYWYILLFFFFKIRNTYRIITVFKIIHLYIYLYIFWNVQHVNFHKRITLSLGLPQTQGQINTSRKASITFRPI